MFELTPERLGSLYEQAFEAGDSDIVIAAGMARHLIAAARERDALRDALREISIGAGRFNVDPQIHANNCIEDMKSIAIAALASDAS